MRVLVKENADGTVSVIMPSLNDKLNGKRPEESEDEACERLIRLTLREFSKPLSDFGQFIDPATLPPRVGIDAQGDPVDHRSAWRMNALTKAVEMDPTKIPPAWNLLLDRLEAVLPTVKQAQLADVLSMIRRACEKRDRNLMQAIYDRLKTWAQANLTAQEIQGVRTTFTEKRIPITL